MGRPQRLAQAALLTVLALGTAAPEVSYYEEAMPSTLNPLFARTMVDRRTQELIFDRLFYRSIGEHKLVSKLVAEFQKTDDRLGITLWLTPDVQWHDGEPLRAEDICFTIAAMKDPGTPSPEARAWRDLFESCTANNRKREVVIRFTRPFFEPRTRLGFPVLPAHKFESTAITPDLPFSARPVGTGPMKAGMGRKEIKFQRVSNAHHKAPIDTLVLSEGGDPEAQVKSLFNNGVQGVISVAPARRPEVAKQDDVALKSYDLRSWWFIAVNTERGALKDPKVREALNLTLDREELRELTIGVDPNDPNPPCELVSGPFIQSSPYYNRAVPVTASANLEQAADLMREAGATQVAGRWVYDDKPITLTIGLHAPLDAESQDILSQVGNQFAAGGFDRQVHKISQDDWTRKAVTGRLTEEYDLLIGKWSFGVAEDVGPLFHTRGGESGALNIFNYSDPEVDAVLDRFEGARTDTEAQNAYHELHARLAVDLPYLFLWKLDTKSAWRTEVRGNTISPYFYWTAFDSWKYGS